MGGVEGFEVVNWAALVLQALALWGWAGLPIQVEETSLQLAVGRAHPHGLAGCLIEVDPTQIVPGDEFSVVLHEVGHCVGYYGPLGQPQTWHSENPDSVMYGFYRSGIHGAVLPEDMAYARGNWYRWLGANPHKIVVGTLAAD